MPVAPATGVIVTTPVVWSTVADAILVVSTPTNAPLATLPLTLYVRASPGVGEVASIWMRDGVLLGIVIAGSYWPMNGRSGVDLAAETVTGKVCVAVVPSVTSVAVTVTLPVAPAGATVVSTWITASGLTSESVAEVMVTALVGCVVAVESFEAVVSVTSLSWVRMSCPSTSCPQIVWW